MATVNMHDAKTNLSKLVARALDGEEIVIARGDKPQVKLVPVEVPQKVRRVAGRLAGKISLDERFFEPMSEEDLRLWEGG